jgi:exodeoxyribonuclease V alpha subunit
MRNSGDIVKACHKIAKGEVYAPSGKLDPDAGFNLRHIEAGTMQTQEIIRSLVVDRLPLRDYNPMWDVQVLSPVNSRGPLSCDALNKILQGMLNPLPKVAAPQPDDDKIHFRVGDKVINTKNMPIGSSRGRSSASYLVNGDMGQITDEIDHGKKWMVRFSDPERNVPIPKKNHNLLLAYCVTCHRMQGSEAPVIIIPVHSSFKFFLNRPWIYTAISRAKDICITVGQFDAIEQSIRQGDSSERKTFLREKLIDNVVADAEV